MREGAAPAGWGGSGRARGYMPSPRALCSRTQKCRCTLRQAAWGTGAEVGSCLAGPQVPCLIQVASDYFQAVFQFFRRIKNLDYHVKLASNSI